MTLDPIAVLFVLQTQDKGYPDNRVTSDPIAVLFVLQTQEEGVPDNRVTSEPIAVLFVLQTQDKGYPDNREEPREERDEEEEKRGRGRKHTTSNRRWGIKKNFNTLGFSEALVIYVLCLYFWIFGRFWAGLPAGRNSSTWVCFPKQSLEKSSYKIFSQNFFV